ncbi:MAG: hypothetical protein ACU84J_16300 [Gammaproteobacteria bacterium]
MSYWQILGIADTSDITAIKRAYAAKLKATKPDEDPEGFQHLHAAYKQALQHAKLNSAPNTPSEATDGPLPLQPAVTDGERVPVFDGVASQTTHASPIEPSLHGAAEDDVFRQELNDIAAAEGADDSAFLQAQWNELTARIDEATGDMAKMNTLASWNFLNDRDVLLDIRFKAEISHYIFGRIAALIKAVRPFIDREVFDLLDNLFLWRDRRDLLERAFGYAAVDSVMRAVPVAHEGGIRWGYVRRVITTMLKLFLFGYIGILLSKYVF